MHKHLGIQDILETVYERIGDVNKVILLGDCAKGIDNGLIEVLIVGKKINRNYLNKITPKIEKKINRKVNFFVSDKVLNQASLVVFEA